MTSVCPRNSVQFYIVSYYMKWVTTSGTYSINLICAEQFLVVKMISLQILKDCFFHQYNEVIYYGHMLYRDMITIRRKLSFSKKVCFPA